MGSPPTEQPRIDTDAIDERLVTALLTEQFPDWSRLPLRAVETGGNDHRTFRLGDELLVRLPSADRCVPQVVKEQRWLPRLAGSVPLAIPELHGAGVASELFPAPWSIYGWLDGETASTAVIRDPVRFAEKLAEFLVGLRAADTGGAPGPGLHSAFRGGPLEHWDDEMQVLFDRVAGRERETAVALWRDALAAPFEGDPVWFHGDVSTNNLILRDGELTGVIDFGCAAAGDPACDTVPVWTFLSGAAREAFREGFAADEATWARGRGWALWKALIMITNIPADQRALARHVLEELMAGV